MSSRDETRKHRAGSDKNKKTDEEVAGSNDDVSFKLQSDRFRWSFEDPMHNYIKLQKIRDKEERVKELQSMLESSSSSSESSDDSLGTSHRKHKKRSRSESSTSHRKHKQRSRSESSTHRKHKQRSRSESSTHRKHKRRKEEKYKSEEWVEKADDKNDTDKEQRKRKKDYKHSKSKKRKRHSEDSRKDQLVDTASEHGVSNTGEFQAKLKNMVSIEKRKLKKSKHCRKKEKHSLSD